MMSRLPVLAGLACLLALIAAQDSQSSGTWTKWSQWSNCSRSCGGGITMQTRECNKTSNETDTTCEGESVKYQMCNIQDCPDDLVDFRMSQCSAYNPIPYKDKYYKWAAFEHAAGECELKCMPKNEFFYVTFKSKVLDGTRCNSKSLDICVDGNCLPVGCDMQLYSEAKIDNCGICNGDNSTCRLISRDVELAPDAHGYVDIASIPSLATNIHVKEIGKIANYIALSSNNEDVLNSDHVFQVDVAKKHDGGNMIYKRDEKVNDLLIDGPLDLPLKLKIFAMKPKGAKFSLQYYVPNSYTKDQERKVNYIWVMDPWEECTRTCAGGQRERNVNCANSLTKKKVKSFYCKKQFKPKSIEECNTQRCPARWYISQWSPCSATCGEGSHTRRIHCVESLRDGNIKMLDFSKCPGSVPTKVEKCFLQEKCPEWVARLWSGCSQTCGEGYETRTVHCMDMSTENSVEERNCPVNQKPDIQRKCFNVPCGAKWEAQEWKECSSHCGIGMRSRTVICRSSKGFEVPVEHCNPEEEPASFGECTAFGPCRPMWHSTEWSKCTARCGYGMQMRSIFCAEKTSNTTLYTIDDESQCSATKPNTLRRCASEKPCNVNYFVSKWGECSATCGTGFHQRSVKCYADRQLDHSQKLCKDLVRPKSVRLCTLQTCENEPYTTPKPAKTTPKIVNTDENSAAKIISYIGPPDLHETDNADYECKVSGQPKPSISWTLNGQQITSSRFITIEIEGGSRLLVLAALSSDEGELKCSTSNKFGKDSKSISIKVSGPPVVTLTPAAIQKEEGEPLVLSCNAEGSPRPRVQWTKDAYTFYGDNNRVIVTKNQIIFKSVVVGDAGKYRCLGFNSAGSGSASASVSIERSSQPERRKDCYDDHTLANCQIIASFNLCTEDFYKDICCATCNKK